MLMSGFNKNIVKSPAIFKALYKPRFVAIYFRNNNQL